MLAYILSALTVAFALCLYVIIEGVIQKRYAYALYGALAIAVIIHTWTRLL